MIKEQLGYFQNMVDQIEQLQGEFDRQTDLAIQTGTYCLDKELEEQINEVVKAEVILDNGLDPKKSCIREIIPPFEQHRFVVTSFSKKRQDKSTVFSPIKNIEGNEWRLKVYPNGN